MKFSVTLIWSNPPLICLLELSWWMFVGWNVEQGRRFAFFSKSKKANQLNAVCRGCMESVRFGFSFALRNGHVFLLFLRAEKSKKTFRGWLQAATYYMQGELGWLEDILLSHVLIPCSCSVSRRGAKSTAAKWDSLTRCLPCLLVGM